MIQESRITAGVHAVRKITEPLPYDQFDPLFEQVKHRGVILESAEVAQIYGRMSLILVDPPLSIQGKGESFWISALNERGEKYLTLLEDSWFKFATDLQRSSTELSGKVARENRLLDESKRHKQPNISLAIKTILDHFKGSDPNFGLYGAFAYDFIRLFEDIPYQKDPVSTPDFTLFFPDQLIVAEHLKEKLQRHVFEFFDHHSTAETVLADRDQQTADQSPVLGGKPTERVNQVSKMDFEQQVKEAREQIRQGEFFEVVLSRSQYYDCPKHPLEVYRRFRRVNPSPYQFYVNFGDEALVGASPEMFLRIEANKVTTRPISGTVERGQDTFEDYDNMMALLNSVKEKSELDMLIDLARNDLSRVCKPGVKVTDYRFVEKYSKVMHTVANVEGELDTERFEPFDALVASLNAGTLTGAPKIAAMRHIEQVEKNPRGYYGGNVGYLTFSGNLDFGIIIRTAHIKGGTAEVRVGATLLYDSDPAAEYQETDHKGRAFFQILEEK